MSVPEFTHAVSGFSLTSDSPLHRVAVYAPQVLIDLVTTKIITVEEARIALGLTSEVNTL